jgi:hypothetical protein
MVENYYFQSGKTQDDFSEPYKDQLYVTMNKKQVLYLISSLSKQVVEEKGKTIMFGLAGEMERGIV